MKNINTKIVVALFAVISTASFASGFRCEGEGYAVKMYNKTTGGTRVPAKMVISHEDASPTTLLVADGEDIHKKNRVNSVQYITDGNSRIGAETVILQVAFKEGRDVIEAGDVVDGQLILTTAFGKEVASLVCERYLKND